MPEEPTTLTFHAIQTYDNGEIVRWTGAPDSDEPAPHLTTYDIGAEEDEGQLGVLARLKETVSEPQGDDDDLTLILGGAGLGLGAIAVVLALIAMRRRP